MPPLTDAVAEPLHRLKQVACVTFDMLTVWPAAEALMAAPLIASTANKRDRIFFILRSVYSAIDLSDETCCAIIFHSETICHDVKIPGRGSIKKYRFIDLSDDIQCEIRKTGVLFSHIPL